MITAPLEIGEADVVTERQPFLHDVLEILGDRKRWAEMSKYLWYGIIEDLDTVRRIPIGRFWGVTLLVTPITWLGPFVYFGLHMLLNVLNPRLSLADRLEQALLFSIAVEITTVLHAFGHILSGKMVRSAMDELLIKFL